MERDLLGDQVVDSSVITILEEISCMCTESDVRLLW
jgi:hypothetical protein